jgi:predicted nucleic acid-binding protein
VFVIETSVFTRLHHRPVRTAIDRLAPVELMRSPVTDLELGNSARNAGEWDEIAAMLLAFDALPLSLVAFERARAVQREFARRGLRGRKLPHLLVAASAEQAGATIVHYDPDFQLIASVTGQPQRWVVERGSID